MFRVAAAMTVIDVGEIYRFIACAAGRDLPVAMKAAALRAARGAGDVSLQSPQQGERE